MEPNARTPLLAGAHDHGDLPPPSGYTVDHPSFIRACHSPWRCLGQNRLVYIRGLILAYLVATGIMLGIFKAEGGDADCSHWRHAFDFADVSFGMLTLYMLVVFSWTFTHLYFPSIDANSSGWEYVILRYMSIPTQLGSLRKQFYFMLFYSATCVASLMNAFYYWLVTRPHNLEEDHPAPQPPSVSSTPQTMPGIGGVPYPPHHYDRPFSDIFGENWFETFNILNAYGFTTILVLIEVFWLNSIKRPVSTAPVILGLMLLSFIYLGWAAIGQIVTGCYSFFWLSEEEAGSREAVVAYSIIFVLMAPILYTLFYGLTAIRESWTANRARTRAAMAAALEHDRDR